MNLVKTRIEKTIYTFELDETECAIIQRCLYKSSKDDFPGSGEQALLTRIINALQKRDQQ